MPIATTCPKCQALFRLPDELAGRKVKCQKCAALFVMPSAGTDMTMPGMPVLIEAEPALVEELQAPAASAAPPPVFALPPLPTDAPSAPRRDDFAEGDRYRDSPLDRPSAPPKKPGDNRPSPRTRRVEKPKARSAKIGVVLGIFGLLLLAFITCAGATGIWYAVRSEAPKNRPIAKGFPKKEFKEFNNPPFGNNQPFPPIANDGFNGLPIQSRPDFDGFKQPEPPPVLQGVCGFITRATGKDGKPPEPPPEGPPGSIRIVFDAKGKFHDANKISLNDPVTPGPPKNRHKLYIVRLEVGYTYQFDMTSPDHSALDPHLWLRDVKGDLMKENDDILVGRDRDSRLIYSPAETGIYRLEATYWQPGLGQQGAPNPAGPYTLIVRHVK